MLYIYKVILTVLRNITMYVCLENKNKNKNKNKSRNKNRNKNIRLRTTLSVYVQKIILKLELFIYFFFSLSTFLLKKVEFQMMKKDKSASKSVFFKESKIHRPQ